MSIGGNISSSRVAALCLILILGLSLASLAVAEQEYTDVYRLGRSATRISGESAVEFDDFQRLFAKHRTEFEKVLAIAGWDGNVDALFAVVAGAKESDDGPVRFRNVEPGEVMPWMALRRKGEPAIIENVRWAAKVPYPAWEILVEDDDSRTIFVVPQWCLNLAFDRVEKVEKKVVPVAVKPPPPPPSPECRLSAMVGEDGFIEIDASGSKGEVELTGLTLPDGSMGEIGMLASSGAGRWTLDPTEFLDRKPGDYAFSFQATSRLSGEEVACDAQAMVTKSKPEGRWIFRAYGTGIIRNHSEEQATLIYALEQRSEKLNVACGFGLGVGLEFMATELIGIDARVQVNQLDSSLVADIGTAWDMDGDDFGYIPVTLAVNFHLFPESAMDFYVGPMIGIASISDTKYNLFGSNVTYDWDSDLGYGLQAGLDIPFGEGQWNFTSGLSFMFMEAEEESRNIEIDLDPATFMVGVGYRF